MRKKSALRRTRQKRELPEPLRPLAGLVELANLIEDEEENRMRCAEERLDEATGEILARTSGAVSRTERNATSSPRCALASAPQTLASLREQAQTADEEMRNILKNFSARARAPEHESAIGTLLRHMRIAEHLRPDEGSLPTLFATVAAVRSALWTVAASLTLQDDIVRLPEACYTPPAILRRVDDRIKVTTVPVIHWLLPVLDGLEAGRLSICEACGKLYVGRRRDQLGCSRRCGDTLYMRRYRNPEYRNRNKSDSKRRQIRKALSALKRKSGLNP
jgi:hypothetical protein